MIDNPEYRADVWHGTTKSAGLQGDGSVQCSRWFPLQPQMHKWGKRYADVLAQPQSQDLKEEVQPV